MKEQNFVKLDPEALKKDYPLVKFLYKNKPIIFLVDSGASTSMLNAEYADVFGDILTTEVPITIEGIAGNTDISRIGYLKFYDEAETYEFEKIFVILSMLTTLNYKDIKLHGILGCDFLNKYNCILDIEKQKLFYDPDFKKDNTNDLTKFL